MMDVLTAIFAGVVTLAVILAVIPKHEPLPPDPTIYRDSRIPGDPQ